MTSIANNSRQLSKQKLCGFSFCILYEVPLNEEEVKIYSVVK